MTALKRIAKPFKIRAPLFPTAEARNLVRDIFRKAPKPPVLSMHRIYEQIHGPTVRTVEKIPSNAKKRKHMLDRLAAEAAEVPHPEHPIRSIKYLKKVVLEDMAARGELEKVTVRRHALDEQGRPIGAIAKTSDGHLELPPEHCDPELRSKKVAWMWRYKAASDRLNRDDPTTPPTEAAEEEPFDTNLEFEEVSREWLAEQTKELEAQPERTRRPERYNYDKDRVNRK